MGKEELFEKLSFMPCHVPVDGQRVLIEDNSVTLIFDKKPSDNEMSVQIINEILGKTPLAKFKPDPKKSVTVFLWALKNAKNQIEELSAKASNSEIATPQFFPMMMTN